jgi:hypothetical protein
MNSLVVSAKCEYSPKLIEYIRSSPALMAVVKFHDVKNGVPPGVTRVPTLITSTGQMIIGGNIKTHLDTLIPSSISPESIGNRFGASIDGAETDSYFDFNSYGTSLKPVMTKELEERINMSVNDAFQNIKK